MSFESDQTTELFEMTIFLKNGHTIQMVNRKDDIELWTDALMGSDSEFDDGNVVIELEGIRMDPTPRAVTALVQPWNVAAVEFLKVSRERVSGALRKRKE